MGYSPWGRKDSDTTERLHFISLPRMNLRNQHLNINSFGDFLGCPVAKILPSNAGGVGSISSWGQTPHAPWPKNQNIEQK